jgi:hypothetical protein
MGAGLGSAGMLELRHLRHFIADAEELNFGCVRSGCTWPNRR